MDQSPEMVRVASARMPHARVVQADAVPLPFADGVLRPARDRPLLRASAARGAASVPRPRRAGSPTGSSSWTPRCARACPARRGRSGCSTTGRATASSSATSPGGRWREELGGGEVLHEGEWFVVVGDGLRAGSRRRTSGPADWPGRGRPARPSRPSKSAAPRSRSPAATRTMSVSASVTVRAGAVAAPRRTRARSPSTTTVHGFAPPSDIVRTYCSSPVKPSARSGRKRRAIPSNRTRSATSEPTVRSIARSGIRRTAPATRSPGVRRRPDRSPAARRARPRRACRGGGAAGQRGADRVPEALLARGLGGVCAGRELGRDLRAEQLECLDDVLVARAPGLHDEHDLVDARLLVAAQQVA